MTRPTTLEILLSFPCGSLRNSDDLISFKEEVFEFILINVGLSASDDLRSVKLGFAPLKFVVAGGDWDTFKS